MNAGALALKITPSSCGVPSRQALRGAKSSTYPPESGRSAPESFLRQDFFFRMDARRATERYSIVADGSDGL